MKRNKFFAAIISLVFVLSAVLGSCASEKQPVSSNFNGTAVDKEATYAEVTYVTETATSDVLKETTNNSIAEKITDVSQNADETVVETTLSSSLPSSIEEIVEYFNVTANKIKPDAKKVVKNYEKRIVNEDKLVFPELLASAASGLIETFMKDDTEPIVYDTREEITNEFLVPNQSYVSRLKPEWVKSAIFKDNGEDYIINIKLKDEKNSVSGSGVGSVCDVIEAHEVAEKVSFVEKFTTEYYNCEVIATVDKSSGNIVHIKYIVSVALELTVNMFGTHDVAAGLTFEKDYSIIY